MSIAETTYLDRLLLPVTECFSEEVAERLLSLRRDSEVEARIEELAAKANEGTLSEDERAEYEEYVEAIDFIGVLQSRARMVLAKRTAK